jgi:murein DD-endopeptidase MepM/ murein hydrolase activator NlpD
LKSGKAGTADLLDDAKPQPIVSTGLYEFNKATPLGASLGLSPKGTARATPPARPLVMHEGVDLAAPPGTPVFAAGDGTVKGAAPNGGYGNWILIEHEGGKLSTVYGHLAAFAPGIEPGARVMQGELIGFVGNTGRSTGPHLHFELLSDGKPVNPMNHPATKRTQLSGLDLERFRAQMKRALREREHEDTVLPAGGS